MLGKRSCLEGSFEAQLVKRSHQDEDDTVYSAFGPIPIAWFDPTLFPASAKVTVYVPTSLMTQVVPVDLGEPLAPVSPTSTAATFQDDSTPFSLCVIPLPEFSDFSVPLKESTFEKLVNVETTIPTVVPKEPVEKQPGEEPELVLCKEPLEVSVKVNKKKPKKTDVNACCLPDVLSLKDVPFYSADRRPFPTGLLFDSLPKSMKTKRRNMKMLQSNCCDWLGVGVLTFVKTNKMRNLMSKVFTDDLESIAQYVRPLGFAEGELVLPSNAICYTSHNKGNNQVTYILTDVLSYKDVVKHYSKVPPKNRRRPAGKDGTKAGVAVRRVKRFSYGMTVLKPHTKPREVQFCLLALLSMAFHLLRKWCRQNPAFAPLLDQNYRELSFEELTHCLLQKSVQVLSSPFSELDIFLLLKRSDCLFKKLVKLFLAMYPDVEGHGTTQ